MDDKERMQAAKHPSYLGNSSKLVTVSHHLAHAWSFAAVLGDLSFCSGAPPAESETMPRTLSIANAVNIRLRHGMFKPSSFAAG
jgi:hypothetical protein